MDYADKSLTKTVGADGRTAGVVGSSIDLDATYAFGADHSAEFKGPLEELQPYYYDLMSNLHLTQNYLDATHP